MKFSIQLLKNLCRLQEIFKILEKLADIFIAADFSQRADVATQNRALAAGASLPPVSC